MSPILCARQSVGRRVRTGVFHQILQDRVHQMGNGPVPNPTGYQGLHYAQSPLGHEIHGVGQNEYLVRIARWVGNPMTHQMEIQKLALIQYV